MVTKAQYLSNAALSLHSYRGGFLNILVQVRQVMLGQRHGQTDAWVGGFIIVHSTALHRDEYAVFTKTNS